MRNAVLVVLAALVPALSAQTRRPWREADLESLVSVSEPALRPDGVQLVYVRGRADLATNLSRSEIVVVAVETGRPLAQWEGTSPRSVQRLARSGGGQELRVVAGWAVDRVRGRRTGRATPGERCQGLFADHAEDPDRFHR